LEVNKKSYILEKKSSNFIKIKGIWTKSKKIVSSAFDYYFNKNLSDISSSIFEV